MVVGGCGGGGGVGDSTSCYVSLPMRHAPWYPIESDVLRSSGITSMSCTAVVVGAYLEYFATIHGGGSGIRDTKTTKMEAARHMETGAPSHSKICFMDCQTNRNISTHWSTQSQVTSTAEIFLPLYHNKFNSTTHENHQPNLTKGFTLQPGFFWVWNVSWCPNYNEMSGKNGHKPP